MARDLLSTLVHIQAHLDGDLSLEALAAHAALSPPHFHRVFRKSTGETPKRYTQRLRLERAALRLCLHRTTILEAALEVGFRNHETFTRAFRRHFGVAPREVAKRGLSALRSVTSHPPLSQTARAASGYQLSASSVVTLRPMHLAFIRHTGPYEEVGDDIWRRLTGWADRRGLDEPRVFLGIGHDAPGITPAAKLRYDAALRVEEPFRGSGAVGYQGLEGGRFVVATHVGHYSTLPEAYPRLFQRIGRMPDLRPKGLPAVEMYHEATMSVGRRLNHTDVYLPVVAASDRLGLGL